MASRFAPDSLTRRVYSYADADALAGVGRGTSKRWIEGYSYSRSGGARVAMPPVTSDREITGGGVSFFDLIEIIAIGRFREIGVPVPRVRRIVTAAQTTFNVRHPLSTLTFKVGARGVFVKQGTVLHDVLGRKAQPAWDDILGPFLETLDYRDAVAYRWWPLGKGKPILLDPEYGFGQPVIAGTGIRTEIIRERFEVGDSITQIANDFNVSSDEVESAIQFELKRTA